MQKPKDSTDSTKSSVQKSNTTIPRSDRDRIEWLWMEQEEWMDKAPWIEVKNGWMKGMWILAHVKGTFLSDPNEPNWVRKQCFRSARDRQSDHSEVSVVSRDLSTASLNAGVGSAAQTPPGPMAL